MKEPLNQQDSFMETILKVARLVSDAVGDNEDVHDPDYLIKNYKDHKDVKGLADAIRDDPSLFNSEGMREFVAGIVRGDIKPPTKGYIKKETIEINKFLVDSISFCHGMGIPIKNSYEFNCCSLSTTEIKKSEHAVYEAWVKGGKKTNVYEWMNGRVYYLLNDRIVPESIEALEDIFKKIEKMSNEEINTYDLNVIDEYFNHFDKLHNF